MGIIPEISALWLHPKSKILKNDPKISYSKIFKMAKIRPEIEISGRFLVCGRKIYIFFGQKNFGRFAGNFGPPATSKENLQKIRPAELKSFFKEFKGLQEF